MGKVVRTSMSRIGSLDKPSRAELMDLWRWVGLKPVKCKDCSDMKDTVYNQEHPESLCHFETRQGKVFVPELTLDSLMSAIVPYVYKKCQVYSITFTLNGVEIETHFEAISRGGSYMKEWTPELYAIALFWALWNLKMKCEAREVLVTKRKLKQLS